MARATLSGWLRRLIRPKRPSRVNRGLGDAARDAGDWKTAVLRYTDHLEAHPADAAIWIQMGHGLKTLGRHAEADAAYAAAAALNDRDPDLWLSRGHLARTTGDRATAIEHYVRSLELDGNPAARAELTALDAADRAGSVLAAAVSDAGEGRFVGGYVDGFDGSVLSGWAVDSRSPDAGVALEVLRGGDVIARGVTSHVREDLVTAGVSNGKAAFRIDLGEMVAMGDALTVRAIGTGEVLRNSPLILAPGPASGRWAARHRHLDIGALKAAYAEQTPDRTLGVILPVPSDGADDLDPAIASVRAQWSERWALICVLAPAADAGVEDRLKALAREEPRIRVVRAETGALPAVLHAGLAAFDGDDVMILGPADFLEPEAVFRFLDAAAGGGDLVYGDEIVIDRDIGNARRFVARPAFSHDYYLSYPYFNRGLSIRTGLLREVIGSAALPDTATETDIVLRCLERADHVAHVPAFLYRRRGAAPSPSPSPSPADDGIAVAAIDRHLRAMGQTAAAATPGVAAGTFRIDYPDDHGRTLMVIPTRDRVDLVKTCLDSIWRTTSDVDIVIVDHDSVEPASRAYFESIGDRVTRVPYSGPFNFAAMNNHAVRVAGAGHAHVVFMNNDIEAIEAGWLERLRGLAARPEVGVVGATLLYADRSVQHSGVTLGVGGCAAHAHGGAAFERDGRREAGYAHSLVVTRDYSAVTAACMMMRMEVFAGVGGFDEDLVVGFNDTDLCLRLGGLGYKILNDPYAVLYHHESATRSRTGQMGHPADAGTFLKRWKGLLAKGDPFYSPLLSLHAEHQLDDFTEMHHPARILPVGAARRPRDGGRGPDVGPPGRPTPGPPPARPHPNPPSRAHPARAAVAPAARRGSGEEGGAAGPVSRRTAAGLAHGLNRRLSFGGDPSADPRPQGPRTGPSRPDVQAGHHRPAPLAAGLFEKVA